MMLNKKLILIPALVALGVFAAQVNLVSAGPDGGGKNGGDHDGGKNGGDGGDGGGKNGGGDGGGGKNGGGDGGGGKNGGGDGGSEGGGGDGGGKNGGDDERVTSRSQANSKPYNRFLAKWRQKQRLRFKCGDAYQQAYAGQCGQQVYVTAAEPVYVQAPARRKHKKARRVVVQQHYNDGYYAEPVVRYVAQASPAAMMQAQKRARRAAMAQVQYQVVDAGCNCDEQQVVVRVQKRKHRKARRVYLPAYDAGAVVHYGPLVDKNGGF